MLNRPSPPYLGAAYYPEVWPLEQMDEDIRLMKEAGMNVMRVAEFAWARMEPEEGHYDFTWLSTAVNKLTQNGIAVIMCTPTCTPPVWLTSRYPETQAMDDNGVRASHGARRHACPNSHLYRVFCRGITKRLIDEFGAHPGVIGWQIDNELYPYGDNGCFCPVCVDKFHKYLEKRYGTVEALNAAWHLNLWSQSYTDFAQVPAPRRSTWHHPSLKTAWSDFQSASYADFCAEQAHLLNATGRPVGTDMMPFGGLDYIDTHRPLSVVQFNHYNNVDDLWQAAFWMDYCRTIKPAPFWNTETSTCWNGSVSANGYRTEGFCRANSLLPFVLGGEANLYWLWRAHPAGQELMHGSVVSSAGRPLHIIKEVREVSHILEVMGAYFGGTKPARADIALAFSCEAWNVFRHQPMVNGFTYKDALLEKAYRPLLEDGYRVDVVDPSLAALEPGDAKLLFLPFLPSLEYGGLRDRLLKWIEAGGICVAGPMTDCRDSDAAKYKGPFSVLEEWAGVYTRFQIPGDPEDFIMMAEDGLSSRGGVWYDGFELTGARALATYVDGPLHGLAAIAGRDIGQGKLVVLGTMPGPDALKALLRSLLEGIAAPVEKSPGLLAVRREGTAGDVLMLLELDGAPSYIKLDRPMRSLIDGQLYLQRTVNVPAYGAMILKEEK